QASGGLWPGALACHSAISVVLPAPGGAEMTVSRWLVPSIKRATRRGRLTIEGWVRGTKSLVDRSVAAESSSGSVAGMPGCPVLVNSTCEWLALPESASQLSSRITVRATLAPANLRCWPQLRDTALGSSE